MIPAAEGFAQLRLALEHAGIRYAVGGSWASSAFGEPRFTNDVDILAELSTENLGAFLERLPATFFADGEEARKAICLDRSFNIIYMPQAFKFDLFPASAFPLGTQELDRATMQAGTGISAEETPFVSPEDILLAKLNWLKAGGGVSEVQWRDIQGLVRVKGATMDREYLESSAKRIGVMDLLSKALRGD